MQVGPGAFSFRLSDTSCPWNDGLWRFDGSGGRLEVAPSDHAECSLSIQGLTALVYGTHDPEDFDVRGWGDPSPELQQTMRAMFPPLAPHLHESF
jgi:hypothetical protein